MLIKFKLEKHSNDNRYSIKFQVLYQNTEFTKCLRESSFILKYGSIQILEIGSLQYPEIVITDRHFAIYLRGDDTPQNEREHIIYFNDELSRDFTYDSIIAGFKALHKKYSYLL